MVVQTHEFAASPLQMRRAIEPYSHWIEGRLGVPLTETMILWTHMELNQLALLHADCADCDPKLVQKGTQELQRFAKAVEAVAYPPGVTPLISLVERRAGESAEQRLAHYDTLQPYAVMWRDGPVALRLRGIDSEVVAVEVTHRNGPDEGETRKNMLVFAKANLGQVTRLLETVTEQKRAPRVHTYSDRSTQEIERYQWDQLTLAPEIKTLLRQDFEMFFEAREWYREMRIPHRRGYLLHGPPGNGKTSAVKAMLTSRNITAYQLRLFDLYTEDKHLEAVFAKAAAKSPAMILLEDIDRAFPKTGGSNCKISLQTLLNCLDGVATGTGIITVATANEPSLLDPAILKRPGRFDRVICFSNPLPELRQEYFTHIHAAFAHADLSEVVELSAGFSFAQLRETYIMAAQFARMDGRCVRPDDLVEGAHTMRSATRNTSRKRDTAGFVASLCEGVPS